MRELEWVIIGGGVHGVHHALVLLERGISRESIRIVDPHPTLLARWTECTTNTGMRFLRSPLVHNLDPAPFALRQFARDVWGNGSIHRHFLGPYRRPSLDVFQAHNRHLTEVRGLGEMHVHGRVNGIAQRGSGLVVRTTRMEMATRRVLLAVGMSEQPAWPDWTFDARAAGADMHHIFEPGFRRSALPRCGRAVVAGGGITAAQTALALADDDPDLQVTVVARHPMRVAPFDSPPGWIGPRYLAAYGREADPVVRRETITAARHRGSMPSDVASAYRRAIATGRIRLRTAEITAVRVDGGAMEIACREPIGGKESVVETDRIVLATGFDPARPGGGWLDEMIEDLGLPCAPCGFPRADSRLHWRHGIHVTGPLAELEIGPVSRNIIGARLASERLAAA